MSLLHKYINYHIEGSKLDAEKEHLSKLESAALSGDLKALRECLEYAYSSGYDACELDSSGDL